MPTKKSRTKIDSTKKTGESSRPGSPSKTHTKSVISDGSRRSSLNGEGLEKKEKKKEDLEGTNSDIGFKPRKNQSRYPKSIVDDRVKVRLYYDPVDNEDDDEEGRSELVVSSQQDFSRAPKIVSKNSTSSSSGSSSSASGIDSIASSINKYRDDFDTFKCKMRIFGESLNLCKCIANDFKRKLAFMETRLTGLEKRHNRAKRESNYTAIIQKNKKLSTKTKEFVKKLQKCGTEAEMREVAGRICHNYLPGLWKVVEPSELSFRRICGGLSNFIYVVGLPEDPSALYARLDKNNSDDEAKSMKSGGESIDEPKKVLLRIYGQVHGERAMDAIVTESVIFTLLSERKLGPKLFGVFSGGRIEEYIPSRPLLVRELADPAFSMKIAEKTAAVHSMEIPLSKEPNYIWKTMAKWLKTVKDEIFNKSIDGKNAIEQAAIYRLKEINYDSEIDWLKKFLATVDSPVVFCHNDLQEGNILILEDDAPQTNTTDGFESATYVQPYDVEGTKSRKENNHTVPGQLSITMKDMSTTSLSDLDMDPTSKAAFSNPPKSRASFMADDINEDANTSDTVLSHTSDSGEPKLYLIDFEYCAYNYRAFDIANHFQEWAYDYTNTEHPFYFENQDHWPTLEQKEIFIRQYLKHYNAYQGDDSPPNIDAVNKLLAEVEAFALASHLFWTLWSIVNASKSQIPFGYWEYGQARLETYLRLKQEVIKKDKCGFPQKRKIEEVDI